MTIEVRVHGGLTFSGKRDYYLPETARCRDWHFFGFDCNHTGDVDPQMAEHWRRNGHPEWADYEGKPTGWREPHHYVTYEEAKEQCTSLARQLAAI